MAHRRRLTVAYLVGNTRTGLPRRMPTSHASGPKMDENSLQHSQLPQSSSDRNPQELRSGTRSRVSKHRPRDRRPVHSVLRRRIARQPRTWRQWRCHRQNQLPDDQCIDHLVGSHVLCPPEHDQQLSRIRRCTRRTTSSPREQLDTPGGSRRQPTHPRPAQELSCATQRSATSTIRGSTQTGRLIGRTTVEPPPPQLQ
jgi:hypothetical protein